MKKQKQLQNKLVEKRCTAFVNTDLNKFTNDCENFLYVEKTITEIHKNISVLLVPDLNSVLDSSGRATKTVERYYFTALYTYLHELTQDELKAHNEKQNAAKSQLKKV